MKEKISPYTCGTTLYMPAANMKFLRDFAEGRLAGIPSFTACLEDSISDAEVPLAMENLRWLMRQEWDAPLFVRPRSPEMLERILRIPGIGRVAGFTLPKFDSGNMDAWLSAAAGFPAMPTLEGIDAFSAPRMEALAERCRDRGIVLFRVGGNDLMKLLGLRRMRGMTLYEGPLGHVLGMLATVFLPRGFSLAAPVFERLDDARTLARELKLDLAHGFCGKTLIHPCQWRSVRKAFEPGKGEAAVASGILGGMKGVFRLDGAMCEPATHSSWARNVLDRAEAFHG